MKCTILNFKKPPANSSRFQPPQSPISLFTQNCQLIAIYALLASVGIGLEYLSLYYSELLCGARFLGLFRDSYNAIPTALLLPSFLCSAGAVFALCKIFGRFWRFFGVVWSAQKSEVLGGKDKKGGFLTVSRLLMGYFWCFSVLVDQKITQNILKTPNFLFLAHHNPILLLLIQTILLTGLTCFFCFWGTLHNWPEQCLKSNYMSMVVLHDANNFIDFLMFIGCFLASYLGCSGCLILWCRGMRGGKRGGEI